MRKVLLIPVALGGLYLTCQGFDSAMTALGMNDTDVEKTVQILTRANGFNSVSPFSLVSTRTLLAIKSSDEATRTQLIRELGAKARAAVRTPEFQKAYDEFIRTRFNAVNHGIVAGSAQANATKAAMADPQAAMRNATLQMAVMYAKSYRQYPIDMLKNLFPTELKQWQEDAAHPGDDQARMKKVVAKAAAVQPLMNSNSDEFRKQYVLLKSMSLGGPSTEAELTAAEASAIPPAQLDQEQRSYDQLNLETSLKKKLDQFIALAATVDFSAETREINRMKRFVNPAYERQSREWKMLYRLGKGPTMAAVEIARQWSKEL